MKPVIISALAGVILAASVLAKPGEAYTLTGKEKSIEDIIKADMEQHPALYEGESLKFYAAKFKNENNIGKRKLRPGDQLIFPETKASLTLSEQDGKNRQTSKQDALPDTFKLRGLSEVVQEGSYCVPASAEVITTFHGIKTDQWEIAKLSSQDSMDNSGTNPTDMARALENFGIHFHRIEYKHARGDVDDFIKKTLPQFKKALVHEGPMYISIREIFGGNHGCVVIGYSDKMEKMYFYNPWGDEFNLSYKEVAKYSYGAIAFTPPKLLGDETVDYTSLIETLKKALPNNAPTFRELGGHLKDAGVSFEFVECNRADAMNDADLTERLARREGQKLLDLALERMPAILIPQTDKEGVTDYLFIRKSQESEGKLLVQRIDSHGWETPELSESRLLIRYWTTPVDAKGVKLWQLPLIEFSGAIEAPSTNLGS